jgi:hypothetical protein
MQSCWRSSLRIIRRFNLPEDELQERETLVISFYEIYPSMNRVIAITHIFKAFFPVIAQKERAMLSALFTWRAPRGVFSSFRRQSGFRACET